MHISEASAHNKSVDKSLITIVNSFMTVAKWYSEEKTYLVADLRESTSRDEFHGCITQMHSLVNEVEHSVSFIIRVPLKTIPGNQLMHFASAFRHQPHNAGRIFIVVPETPSNKQM